MRTRILAWSLLLLLPLSAAPICVDFQSFANGTNFPNGASFEENTVPMTTTRVRDPGGTPIPYGSVQIAASGGNRRLILGGAAVCFDFGCAESVTFDYVNNGGFVTLEVDGDRYEGSVFPGGSTTIGGATVQVGGSSISIAALTSAISTVCIGGQELIIDNVCFEPCEAPGSEDCFEFEAFGGKSFETGEVIEEDGFAIEVIGFDRGSGAIEGVSGNAAGHRGVEMEMVKAGISFSGFCSSVLMLDYAQLSQGVEVTVNGVTVQAGSVDELDGVTVGGVVIGVKGGASGSLTFTGVIESFAIGGEELRIDHLCRQPCDLNCIDFEEPPVGTKYSAGDEFSEDGYTFGFDKFEGAGEATIRDDGRAGASGQDLQLDGASIAGRFECMEAFELNFGQYDTGVIVEINGEAATTNSIENLHGVRVGGVELTVSRVDQVIGGIRGVLSGDGLFEEFRIGGVDLFIDHLCLMPCPDPDCVDFEMLPLESLFVDGDVITEEMTGLEVFDFLGTAKVGVNAGNAAGGTGNEIFLTNAGLRIRYVCAQELSFRYHDAGGAVSLNVDGSAAPPRPDFAAYDGATVGGVQVSVSGGPDTGIVTLSGVFQQVSIAGAELHLDEICFEPCVTLGECLDFEELPAAGVWLALDDFIEDGVEIQTRFLLDGSGELVDVDPALKTGSNQRAGHVGQDLDFDNAVAEFDFGQECVTNLSLHYGEYSGIVRVELNFDSVVATDLADLNGTTLGGRTLYVTQVPVTGGVVGILRVDGPVVNFAIGGEDFHIDRVCFEDCEPIVLGELRIVSAEPVDAVNRRVVMQVEVAGPAVLELRGNTDLGPTRPVIPSATFTNPAPGVFEVEVLRPLGDPRWFFWVDADYF